MIFVKTIPCIPKSVASQGSLPATVNPKEAAFGALSLVSGVIANWVLDPKCISLERHAASLVDTYFRGLAAKPAKVHKRAA